MKISWPWKRARKPDQSSDERWRDFVIKPNSETLARQRAEDELWFRAARRLFFKRVAKMPGILPGKAQYLTQKLVPNTRRDPFAEFRGTPTLSTKHKKQIGLNARRKYFTQVIECFDPSSFSLRDPQHELLVIIRSVWFASDREVGLAHARGIGAKQVSVTSCTPCECYRRDKYAIDHVPAFPHEDCPLEWCMCFVYPVVPGFDD